MAAPPHTFPVSVGLLDPRHVRAMGLSVWEYLWFLEHVTQDQAEDGDYVGLVFNGRPIGIQEVAGALGLEPRTCRNHIARLAKAGYILKKKTATGAHIFSVTKSKRWAWKRASNTAEPETG